MARPATRLSAQRTARLSRCSRAATSTAISSAFSLGPWTRRCRGCFPKSRHTSARHRDRQQDPARVARVKTAGHLRRSTGPWPAKQNGRTTAGGGRNGGGTGSGGGGGRGSAAGEGGGGGGV